MSETAHQATLEEEEAAPLEEKATLEEEAAHVGSKPSEDWAPKYYAPAAAPRASPVEGAPLEE